MRRSIRKFNIPPGNPWAFELLKIGVFKFPPGSGKKSRSNALPISTELPLLKDKFRLQSNTLHAFQREICHNDTFDPFLKTFLKSYSLTRAKFYRVNPSDPARTEKHTGVLRQNKRYIRFKFPTLPTEPLNFPLPEHDAQSNARGMPGGCCRFELIGAKYIGHSGSLSHSLRILSFVQISFLVAD